MKKGSGGSRSGEFKLKMDVLGDVEEGGRQGCSC